MQAWRCAMRSFGRLSSSWPCLEGNRLSKLPPGFCELSCLKDTRCDAHLSIKLHPVYILYIYAYTCIHSAHAHKNSKLITNKMKKILNLYVLLDMGCLELTGAAMPCKSFATTSRGFWPASQPAAFAGQVLSTVMQSEWTVIVHQLHFDSCTAGSGQSFGFFC